MGIAWNVGDALTYKVLVLDGKCEHMLNCSVVLPQNPNLNVPPNLTGYQVDNMCWGLYGYGTSERQTIS